MNCLCQRVGSREPGRGCLYSPSFREKLFDKSEWAPFWGPTRAVKRGEKRPYCALGHQKYAIQTLTAIFQTVSEGKFPETRRAPVLLPQEREMLPPSHRTGHGRYSLSFRHTQFSETQESRRHRRGAGCLY